MKRNKVLCKGSRVLLITNPGFRRFRRGTRHGSCHDVPYFRRSGDPPTSTVTSSPLFFFFRNPSLRGSAQQHTPTRTPSGDPRLYPGRERAQPSVRARVLRRGPTSLPSRVPLGHGLFLSREAHAPTARPSAALEPTGNFRHTSQWTGRSIAGTGPTARRLCPVAQGRRDRVPSRHRYLISGITMPYSGRLRPPST